MPSENELPTTCDRGEQPSASLGNDIPAKIELLTGSKTGDPYQLFAGLVAAGRSGLCLTRHNRDEVNRKLPLDNVRLHFLQEGDHLLSITDFLQLLNSFMDQTPRSAILFDGVDELVHSQGEEAMRSILTRLWTYALFHDTRILFYAETLQLTHELAAMVQHLTRQAAAARVSLRARVNADNAAVRLWLENASDVVLVLDLDGRIAYLNTRVEELSGQPRDFWLGRHFSSLVLPEDLPIAMRSLHRSLLGGREAVEVHLRKSRGREVQLSLSANPIYEKGMLTGLLCIGHDMSKWNEAQDKIRRRSEQLSTLYGISTALTQSLELDRVLSECLLRILALLRMDAAKIRLWDTRNSRPGPVRASIGFEDPEAEPFEIREDAATGQLVVEAESTQQNGFVASVSVEAEPSNSGDPPPSPITYHVLPLRAKGKTVGVLTLATERASELPSDEQNFLQSIATQVAIAVENAQLFEELRRKTDEVAAKNSELEDFVRIASHDLRSPLVSVQGFVEAFLEEFGETIPPKGREFLNRVLRNTVQMQELISRLQELTQAGYGIHSSERVNLNLLVREIVSVLEPKTRRGKIRVDIQPLPAVTGDPVRLRQLFLNLIDNAVKYSPEDRPSKVEIGHANGVFYVRDQGQGIPEEKIEAIFRPMVRLVRDREGIGMGLAIVRRVVESLGGQIWVESEPGIGTTFFFRIEPV